MRVDDELDHVKPQWLTARFARSLRQLVRRGELEVQRDEVDRVCAAIAETFAECDAWKANHPDS
jgi:hypothetical protein